MASNQLWAEFGTVPNVIAVSSLSGGHRGRGGWAAWVGRTVPFLKHVELLCTFSVLPQRSQSVPHSWYCLWKSPHDQIPKLLPLLGVTEQDLCMLFFLNCILLFCFPSLSYSPLSLPLWGGLGPDLTPHWKAAHALQPLSFIFGWVKAEVGWTWWQHTSLQFPEPDAGNNLLCLCPVPRGCRVALARAGWGMGPALCWAGMGEQHPDHSPGPCPCPALLSGHHGTQGEQKNRTNAWQYCLSTLS